MDKRPITSGEEDLLKSVFADTQHTNNTQTALLALTQQLPQA